MRFVKLILTLSMLLTAFGGDYIVFKSKYSESQVFRAFADSLVHGTIGFLSSALFFNYKVNVSTQASVVFILICTFLSSAIDIDHVFVAKSIQIKDVLNLNQRGIFHCTTFWIIITTIFYAYSYITRKVNLYIFTFMLLLAISSHHIRDGNRRGLWVYPYGHTWPIHKYLYVFLLCVLPNVFAYLFILKRDYFKEVDYMVV